MSRVFGFALAALLTAGAAYGAWHYLLQSESEHDGETAIEDTGRDPESSDRAAVRFLSATADLDLTTDQERVVGPLLRNCWQAARKALAEVDVASFGPEERAAATRRAILQNMARLQLGLKDVLEPDQIATVCNAYLGRLPALPSGTPKPGGVIRHGEK